MNGNLTKSQKRIIASMRAGQTLWLFGDNGYEMEGLPESRSYYPQKRTIDILLEKGLLRYKPYRNDTQRECGICELGVVD